MIKIKLLTAVLLLTFIGFFSACSEEEIYPQKDHGIASTDGNGIAKYDEDF